MKTHSSSVILLLVSAALALSLLALTGCASGSSLVTGVRRAPVPAETVRVYDTMPAGSRVIGLVRAHSVLALGEQGHLEAAVAELRAQASRLGADGIVIIRSADQAIAYVGGDRKSGASGVAINTPHLEAHAFRVEAP